MGASLRRGAEPTTKYTLQVVLEARENPRYSDPCLYHHVHVDFHSPIQFPGCLDHTAPSMQEPPKPGKAMRVQGHKARRLLHLQL